MNHPNDIIAFLHDQEEYILSFTLLHIVASTNCLTNDEMNDLVAVINRLQYVAIAKWEDIADSN
jgi:hypothetical protein